MLADIGTDHARVPIYLIKSGKISRAIASDISKGPLEKAKENLLYYNLSNQVELRLGDGLKTIHPGDADCAVIAGMGGELMASILMEYIPGGLKRIILQPMTDPHLVRRALCSLHYTIVSEDIISENGKMYIVIAAEPGELTLTSEEEYVSPALAKHPLCEEYLLYRLKRLHKAATQAENAGAATHIVHEYKTIKYFLEK